MKHTVKVVALLLGMFFLTQLVGLAVLKAYTPVTTQVIDTEGNVKNVTDYNLPYGTQPPEDNNPKLNLISFMIALVIGVLLMFFLMRFRANVVIRGWFFLIISLALAIAINAAFLKFEHSSLIAILIALPLAFLKVFKRNIYVHNITELLIYPGIAAIFVPLLNIPTVVIFLIFISLYDAYAVWHAGFMQKMAKYQIEHLKVFSGFFVPYKGQQEQGAAVKTVKPSKKNLKLQEQNAKVQVAILGGGDVIFPIILAGVVLRTMGLAPALMISVGATFALGLLFLYSQKGKFYPAMPFITAGCFAALGLVYLF